MHEVAELIQLHLPDAELAKVEGNFSEEKFNSSWSKKNYILMISARSKPLFHSDSLLFESLRCCRSKFAPSMKGILKPESTREADGPYTKNQRISHDQVVLQQTVHRASHALEDADEAGVQAATNVAATVWYRANRPTLRQLALRQ